MTVGLSRDGGDANDVIDVNDMYAVDAVDVNASDARMPVMVLLPVVTLAIGVIQHHYHVSCQ